MFGLSFAKVPPTTHIVQFVRGRARRQGAGLSFVYWAPTATIVHIPVGSTALPFAFTEVTQDFQGVTLQGQLVYRVADPAKLATLLDFSVKQNGAYSSEDPEKLKQRLVLTIQVNMRTIVQQMQLREVLIGSARIAEGALARVRAADAVTQLGVEVLEVSLLAAKPTPETARALEAEAREALLRQADEAIYARRNAAVEEERKIKESELNTQIAVEQKTQEIREAHMAADIAVEEQRAALIVKKADNDRIDADSRAYALETIIKAAGDVDWRILTALSTGSADPRSTIALAFRELAANAPKIGELNITPDLLRTLVSSAASKAG